MELKEAIKNKNPKAIYQEISNTVNNSLIDYNGIMKDIMEDQTTEEFFLALSLAWITACAEDAGQKWAYDDRNAYSVRICTRLTQTGMFQDGTMREYFTDNTARKTVELLRDIHRTLKQTFSSLVFRYLREKSKGHLKLRESIRELDRECGTGWERCPII